MKRMKNICKNCKYFEPLEGSKYGKCGVFISNPELEQIYKENSDKYPLFDDRDKHNFITLAYRGEYVMVVVNENHNSIHFEPKVSN